jgi:hypothetical protein
MGHIQNDASNNSSIVACVIVAEVTFLPSRCLKTIRGFLPSRCLATIGRFLQSRCLATIRVLLPSRCLATIGGYTDRHTQIATWSYMPTLCFQNKKIRLKIPQWTMSWLCSLYTVIVVVARTMLSGSQVTKTLRFFRLRMEGLASIW